ncbi:hypothetical protein SAMN02910369_02580 [Lachnospiraceae bacterium NE2001]|nr:hypothetical protein SAMN02910369_02580 [Lachnospiraceae bacterium NE2001]
MRILLIMPKFFDYHIIIKNELTQMGYEVDFFDDRPSTNAFVKAVIRLNKKMVNGYIKRYFNKIMKSVQSKKYDFVFLISGQSLSLSKEMIEKIKKSQKNAIFLLYQWDSLKNFGYIRDMYPLFDKCYSFDRDDVKNNANLNFLPLFYSNNYRKIGDRKSIDYQYDFCFIGTAHPKKYVYINKISRQLKAVYPNQFIYFYFQSPIVFFYRKLVNREMRKARYNEFNYSPLKGKAFFDIYRKSRCVIDSAQDGQVGLTIRVIEALGAKKKIITTNCDVINYDFYKPENIYVYKGNIDYNDVFFRSEYKEIEKNVYDKYHIRHWLKTILEDVS